MGDHNILQCPRIIPKEKEKVDSHMNFDGESAFLSCTTGLEMFMFTSSLEEVYFQYEVPKNSK